MLNKEQIIKVKGTWIPLGNLNNTIGIQIRMNSDSVIDNLEMMAPRALHRHSRLASPLTGPPRGYGESEDPGPLASLDHPAPGQTGQEGGQRPNRVRG